MVKEGEEGGVRPLNQPTERTKEDKRLHAGTETVR